MYYYLAKASWDSQYNPAIARMSVEEYAKSGYIENNWLTRFLVDKPGGKLTHVDMLLAKKSIKFKCLVGLYDDMEVSMARFQRYFGWNAHDSPEKKAGVIKCRSAAVAKGDKNVLGHPISIKDEYAASSSVAAVKAGSKAWNAILRMNKFDMELYEYAKKIYRIQGEQIFDVVGYEAPLPQHPPAGAYSSNTAVLDSMKFQPSSPRDAGKSMAFETAFDDTAKIMSSNDMNVDALFGDSGKSMDMDAFGDSGKSMTVDAFEDSGKSRVVDALFQASGESMDVDAVEDNASSSLLRTGDIANTFEDSGKSMEVDAFQDSSGMAVERVADNKSMLGTDSLSVDMVGEEKPAAYVKEDESLNHLGDDI